ncbi:hypothetical protein [Litchfieldia alkalitelluris]|nr:hypothetical protein [Litchfieldia alkalitelluris]
MKNEDKIKLQASTDPDRKRTVEFPKERQNKNVNEAMYKEVERQLTSD